MLFHHQVGLGVKFDISGGNPKQIPIEYTQRTTPWSLKIPFSHQEFRIAGTRSKAHELQIDDRCLETGGHGPLPLTTKPYI